MPPNFTGKSENCYKDQNSARATKIKRREARGRQQAPNCRETKRIVSVKPREQTGVNHSNFALSADKEQNKYFRCSLTTFKVFGAELPSEVGFDTKITVHSQTGDTILTEKRDPSTANAEGSRKKRTQREFAKPYP